MGTSASTQQDVSPSVTSAMQAHGLTALSPLQVQQRGSYPQAPIPLSLEALEAHNAQMLQHSPPPILNSPSSAHSDGYKWRKYGQKSVKGSDYPRNYYKCTFPGCTVKKYVEKYEEDGKVLEKVTYKGGDHTHDPSRITRVNATDQTSFKQSVLSESLGHQELIVKAEPRTEGLEIVDQSGIVLPEHAGQTIFPASPRLVVETTADVDHNDDGYSWRKYGQKNVKSSSYPTPSFRSYYRCTQEDCPVKKQVEQRGNIIYNTYEGTHNHLAPGWEEVNKKKKRKLNRSSLEKSLMNRVIEENKPELEGDLSEKTIEEGEALPKGFHHPTAEEAMTLVIAEAAHAHDRGALNIPLQDLQSESGLSSQGIPENISLQMSGGIPIEQLQQSPVSQQDSQ